MYKTTKIGQTHQNLENMLGEESQNQHLLFSTWPEDDGRHKKCQKCKKNDTF